MKRRATRAGGAIRVRAESLLGQTQARSTAYRWARNARQQYHVLSARVETVEEEGERWYLVWEELRG